MLTAAKAILNEFEAKIPKGEKHRDAWLKGLLLNEVVNLRERLAAATQHPDTCMCVLCLERGRRRAS